jgi:hypothetical protein
MANEGRKEWNIVLLNSRTKKKINDDTGVFQVYSDGIPERLQIFTVAGADVSQQLSGFADDYASATMTDGTLRFWTARTVTTVDVSILTAGGRSYFLDGVVQGEHRVDVDPDAQDFVLTVAVGDRGKASHIRKLGFGLKKGMVIKDVIANVKALFKGAAASTNNASLGTSGTPSGFLALIELSVTGFKQGVATLSSTGAVTASLRGLDLVDKEIGDVSIRQGFHQRKPFLALTGSATNNLVFKRVTTITATTIGETVLAGRMYVHYMYTLLPSIRSADNLK